MKNLKLDRHEVMEILKIKPSKQVGDILDALFTMAENKKTPNEREALIQEIKNTTSN